MIALAEPLIGKFCLGKCSKDAQVCSHRPLQTGVLEAQQQCKHQVRHAKRSLWSGGDDNLSARLVRDFRGSSYRSQRCNCARRNNTLM